MWRSASGVSDGQSPGLFLHWLRLSRQGCLSGAQCRRFDEASIGRHQVAGLEQQHIATHDLRRGDHCGVTVAHHPGPGRGQARQRGHGLLGAIFLEEADAPR